MLLAYAFLQFTKDAALADACLTREQYHLTLTLSGLTPAFQEQRKLAVAPNEFLESPCSRSFEPALLEYGTHLERRNRVIETLYRSRLERLESESPFHQLSGRVSYDHATGRRQTLEARGQVRRFTYDRPF